MSSIAASVADTDVGVGEGLAVGVVEADVDPPPGEIPELGWLAGAEQAAITAIPTTSRRCQVQDGLVRGGAVTAPPSCVDLRDLMQRPPTPRANGR